MLSDIRAEIRAVNPEPKCSGCGAGIARPKCMFELSPVDCPRHEQRREWEQKMRREESEARCSGAGDVPMEIKQ
jgi:hypothetical protein